MIIHLMGDSTVGGLIKALQEFDELAPVSVFDTDTLVSYAIHSIKQDQGSSKVVIYT